MKKTLLFACLMLVPFAYSQKILNSTLELQFDENGVVEYIDSTVNNYTSGNYYFNEFKPKLGYDGDILYYFIEDLFIHCQSTDKYQGFSYPLAHIGTITNTLTNEMVTSSVFNGGGTRILFAYDSQSQKISEVYQLFNGTTWSSNDSTIFEYNSDGNKTLEAGYSIGGGTYALDYVDSLWYQTGTNNLTKSTNYYNDGTNLVFGSQTSVVYNGAEIDYLDLLEDDGNGGVNWYFRLNYQYLGNVLTGFDAYEVVNNVPSSTAIIVGAFTYTAQNEIESYTLSEGTDTLGKTIFNYDAEGFVNQVANYEQGNTAVHLSWATHYYFTNVATVNEVDNIEISIYPNPTAHVLRIQSSELVNHIQIFNMAGNVLLEQNNTSEIDVSHLSNGNYIIRGTSKNKVFSKSFVKK